MGVSEKTILRRLQRGALAGHKVVGQFGPEWRILAQDRTAQDNFSAQDTPAQVIEIAQDSITTILKNENELLRKQLEGAIFRNGYLEAKLDERENTIKLLTDSQHKPGWWNKFKSWFLGAP